MYAPANIGASLEAIKSAEKELGVLFPDELKWIWQVANGLDLPNGWHMHPVFDPSNPKKTCNSIVYENAPGKGRWGYMPDNLISIANNGTGNQLVLTIVDGCLAPDVLVWNHSRNATKSWGKTLDYILKQAEAKIELITKARAKSLHGMLK